MSSDVHVRMTADGGSVQKQATFGLSNLQSYLDLDTRKPVFGAVRTTKAQSSLRIHTG